MIVVDDDGVGVGPSILAYSIDGAHTLTVLMPFAGAFQIYLLKVRRHGVEAAEIMEKKVVSLGAGSSLIDAASLMHEHNIRHLPIVEHNEVVGILSERDLRGFLEELYESTQETSDGFRRKNISIREVMQNKPLTVDPSADVVDMIDLMIENKVGALIVSDELGQLKGIVSYEDILKVAREQWAAV